MLAGLVQVRAPQQAVAGGGGEAAQLADQIGEVVACRGGHRLPDYPAPSDPDRQSQGRRKKSSRNCGYFPGTNAWTLPPSVAGFTSAYQITVLPSDPNLQSTLQCLNTPGTFPGTSTRKRGQNRVKQRNSCGFCSTLLLVSICLLL